MLTFEGQQFVGAEAIVKKLTVSCLLNSANQFGSVEILGELARRKNVQAVSNKNFCFNGFELSVCLLYTSPSPRDLSTSRMPSSA